ncbi:MAG: hypothetical protein FWG55_01525 [Candidatus Bathyarchaeota archaeon]|nr:hypothetical protein [Candidatus Termiticorpusculum sp.]
MDIESKLYVTRKTVSVFTLLTILLVSSPSSIFSDVSLFALGASNQGVSNETELKNAVNNAVGSTTIVLDKDIQLTATLIISANKDITLTSNSKSEFFKLIGPNEQSTITVNNDGVLKLDGIIITHVVSSIGSGVTVDSGGTLIMNSGEISGNSGNDGTLIHSFSGVGVCNMGDFMLYGGVISNNMFGWFGSVLNLGNFTMFGGEISGNDAGYGSGVYNRANGIFNMTGGEISDNNAYWFGGGVYNEATFVMSGGKISGNTVANGHSGGVYNWGDFSLYGGEITNNIAWDGGGVGNYGVFIMSGGVLSGNTASNNGGGVVNGQTISQANFQMAGGVISNNTAIKGGGVYHFFWSSFSLSDGVISNNTAEIGGGVCMDNDFTMSGGEISGNIASNNGGGVYLGNGVFKLSGGKISKNTAAYNGGGVWVDTEKLDLLFVSNGVVFSNNRASVAYDRDSTHDSVYSSQIGNRVTWTTPFTQGYNNYDISYTSGTQVTVTDDGTSCSDNSSSGIEGYFVFIVVSLVLVVGIIVGCLFLYFRRHKNYLKHV